MHLIQTILSSRKAAAFHEAREGGMIPFLSLFVFFLFFDMPHMFPSSYRSRLRTLGWAPGCPIGQDLQTQRLSGGAGRECFLCSTRMLPATRERFQADKKPHRKPNEDQRNSIVFVWIHVWVRTGCVASFQNCIHGMRTKDRTIARGMNPPVVDTDIPLP